MFSEAGSAAGSPALERRYTKDYAMHNLLDRPSNRPKRTAAGSAIFAFLAMLFIASSTDVIANFFHVSLNSVVVAMRILVVLAPFIAYPITYKIAKEIPPEWYNFDQDALYQLLERLLARRRRVRDLIVAAKDTYRQPFPTWK